MSSVRDDYSFVGGGTLKLKGSKSSKIEKKPKPKRKNHNIGKAAGDDKAPSDINNTEALGDVQRAESESRVFEADNLKDLAKTTAEIRHDKRRKKMASERLKREGVKSHKEKVEDFNKHLSRLSEHHDMPRIGPG